MPRTAGSPNALRRLAVALAIIVCPALTASPQASAQNSSLWRVTTLDGSVRRLAVREARLVATATEDDASAVVWVGLGGAIERLPGRALLRLERDEADELLSHLASASPVRGARDTPANPTFLAGNTDRIVLLRDGQRWAGAIHPETTADTLVWNHPLLGRLVAPLTRVAVLESRTPGLTAVEAHSDAEDVLRLDNGDLIRGIVTRLTPEHVTLDTRDGTVNIPWSSVRRLTLAESDASPTRPADAATQGTSAGPDPDGYLRVELADGTVIRAKSVEVEGERVRLRVGDESRDLSTTNVLCVERMSPWGADSSGDVWPLTLCSPATVVHTPLLTSRRPPVFDGTVSGRPLQVDGRPLRRGLSLAAFSRVTWDVPPHASSLRLGVGMDPDAVVGSAVFRVRWHDRDEQVLWEAVLTPGPARWIELPLPAARRGGHAARLSLEADFGPSGGVQPWVGVLDPVLVR